MSMLDGVTEGELYEGAVRFFEGMAKRPREVDREFAEHGLKTLKYRPPARIVVDRGRD